MIKLYIFVKKYRNNCRLHNQVFQSIEFMSSYKQQRSVIMNNYILTKQNCLSLSNQTDSLLVSSSIRASTFAQMSNVKKQKRLNSQRLDKNIMRLQSNMLQYNLDECESQLGNRNRYENNDKNNKMSQITIADCIPQGQQEQNNGVIKSKDKMNKNINTKINNMKYPSVTDNPPMILSQQCKKCKQQTPILNQKLIKTTHRLQQLQTLVKLCFSKSMSIQSQMKQNTNEFINIKMRMDENQKMIKKHDQLLVKSRVSKGIDYDEIKKTIQSLKYKIDDKNKQINQIIQLENSLINQKIQKITIVNQQRFQSLIEMVQQLAKIDKSHSISAKAQIINNSNIYNQDNNRNILNKDNYIKDIRQNKNDIQNNKKDIQNNKKDIQNNKKDIQNHKKAQQFITKTKQFDLNQQSLSKKQQQNLSINSFSNKNNNKQPLYHTHRREQKQRTQSKSKISYYLSKSNFNDATTLSDTMINPLQNIIQ